MRLLTASAIAATLLFAQVPAHGQATTTSTTTMKTKTRKTHKETETEREIRELREKLAEQQGEINSLKLDKSTSDSQLSTAQQAAADAQAQATTAAAQAAAAQAAATAAETKADSASISVTDLKTTTAGLTDTVIANQKKTQEEIESPTAIHYKGILIQPSGYLAGETVFRTRAENADISTALSATPYPNSAFYHLTEFNGSARQSRLAALFTSPSFSWGKAAGYVETDFLGAGTTSNNNATNSYVLRMRVGFGQVALTNGFTFSGGQMWSLLTPVKKGISPGPGAEATTNQIDPNFEPGFPLVRQYGLRFTQSLAANKVNLGFSLEESQIVLATTVNAPFNFVLGGPGAAGGLFNSTGASSGSPATPGVQNYTDNLAPDIHVKATFDPGYGHYEIGATARFFRDRVYPQSTFSSTSSATDSTVGVNYTTLGGGVFASASLPMSKYFDLLLHGKTGPGMGRYGAGNLGDVTVRPTGQLEPLKSSQGVMELDFHPTKKLDIFTINGIEYLQRTVYVAPTGVQVGYGAITGQNDSGCHTQTAPTSNTGYGYGITANCTGATRYLLEDTVGLTYRFYSSPTKGRFQGSINYSYLDRESWQGYTGTSYANSVATGPSAFHGVQGINNMVFTSFRYYIP